eukprot:2147923-Rhodomonas_salina.1
MSGTAPGRAAYRESTARRRIPRIPGAQASANAAHCCSKRPSQYRRSTPYASSVLRIAFALRMSGTDSAVCAYPRPHRLPFYPFLDPFKQRKELR